MAAAFAWVSKRAHPLRFARRLGLAPAGARCIGSLEALAATLARWPTDGHWVLKGMYSAAGRERHVGRGPRLSPLDRRRAERLLARHGALLLEPWHARTLDLGVCAWVDERGRVRDIALHCLQVDGYGRLHALCLPPADDARWPLLRRGERALLRRALAQTGRMLAARGYRGPFGIDAWRYRDRNGKERFHPLGEINPRLTLGHLAHRSVARLRAAGVLAPNVAVTLRLARTDRRPPPADHVPLLNPAADDPFAIWFEPSKPPAT